MEAHSMSAREPERDEQLGMDAAGWRAMAWYGWGSPVGLGLFLLLLAGAVAVIILAVRH
jgi:hypothetical protein